MTTPKGIDEIPEIFFTWNDILSGGLPALLAREAEEKGPLLKLKDKWQPGENYILFMVGPEANRFVLHTHRQHFSHDQGWTPLIGDTLGHGLLNMDEPEHTIHRRLWNPAFASAYMTAYYPIIKKVIEHRTASWPGETEIDLFHEAREITFDVAAAALGGIERGEEVDHLRDLFYRLLHGYDSSMGSYEDYLVEEKRITGELTRILLGLIAERRKLKPTDKPRDVLEMIVHAKDDQGNTLDDTQVLAHTNILLVAGHETTTSLSAWVLYLLAANPEYREKILAELDSLPSNPDGSVTLEALRDARFLDVFIKEAGRLYPPVINVPRGILQDFEFAGYHVPAGMQVRLAIGGAHHLGRVFDNPETFDPTRFLPPRDEEKRTPYSLITFGGGPRICIGMYFAQVEVKALVAKVLRSFEIEPVENQNLRHAGHWTAFLPDGIKIRVKNREAVNA
jgi:cytochrome P450